MPTVTVLAGGGSAITPEELTFWRLLQRVQVRVTRVLEADLLVEHDLSLAAYEVLARLSEAPGRRLRMNDLADRVLLSRSGLTRLIDRLQGEGLVEREACPSDARGLYAVLTEPGAARLAAAMPTYLRAIRERFLDLLDATELRHCSALLTRVFERTVACPPPRDQRPRPTDVPG
ncbi:MarR family transcriptional regulator [Thermopolyspora sp. NPDC052614]|uniref:MarR family winged helix-turn-helix transcriptional regulator n=1 Tax=Thermopolyspora sp. NPDC052614 TaxID=3155682 RepID=UPI00343CE649